MRPGTEEEKELLLEAGAELASIGANNQTLSFFGLRWMQENRYKGAVEKLRAWGLPMMVSPSNATIEANDHIVSTKFGRLASSQQRRLVCAFDRTYIEAAMQLFRGDSGPCFAGGRIVGCSCFPCLASPAMFIPCSDLNKRVQLSNCLFSPSPFLLVWRSTSPRWFR